MIWHLMKYLLPNKRGPSTYFLHPIDRLDPSSYLEDRYGKPRVSKGYVECSRYDLYLSSIGAVSMRHFSTGIRHK